MSLVKRAVVMSAIGQYSLQIINFITVAFLARLLTPEEIGLFAVGTSIAFIANEVRSFGVAEYLVREKNINEETIRNVLGVMIIMSWGLGLVLVASAYWIAKFYQVDDLKIILWIITVPFFFAPHSSVPVALISRSMNFDALLRVNLAGCLGRSTVSIGLVLMGYSYFGLAYGTLTGVVVEFLVITYYRPTNMPWLPSFSKVKQVFRVGVVISSAKFLASSSQNASDLLLGKLASMHSVGMYSRGLGLVLFLQSLLVKAVAPVALPHLSEVQRRGGSVKDAYLNSVVLVGAITIPVFAVVNLASQAMITALFGHQWDMAVHISSILALWAIIQSIHSFINPLLLTIHKEGFFLLKEVVSILVKVILVIIAVPYGLEYVAWGFVLSAIVDFLFISVICHHAVGLKISETLKAFRSNFLIAGMCWIVLKGIFQMGLLDGLNSWFTLLVIGAAMVPIWIVGIRVTGSSLWPHLLQIFMRLKLVITKQTTM